MPPLIPLHPFSVKGDDLFRRAPLCCVDGLEFPRKLGGFRQSGIYRFTRIVGGRQRATAYPAYFVGFRFTSDATFTNEGRCTCECCEFQQYRAGVWVSDDTNVPGPFKEYAEGMNRSFPFAIDAVPHRRELSEEKKAKIRNSYGDRHLREDPSRAIPDAYVSGPSAVASAVAAAEGAIGKSSDDLRGRRRKDSATGRTQYLPLVDKHGRPLWGSNPLQDAWGNAARSLQIAQAKGDASQKPENTRKAGCYYFAMDRPGFVIAPGQKVYALYVFACRIWSPGCQIDGPIYDAFLVAIEADWTNAVQGNRFVFEPPRSLRIGVEGVDKKKLKQGSKKEKGVKVGTSASDVLSTLVGKTLSIRGKNTSGTDLYVEKFSKVLTQWRDKLDLQLAPKQKRW